MAYEIPRIVSVNGRNIVIAHLDLPVSPSTYLASAVAATGTTLTVLNNSGFANTDLYRIGRLGREKTEIKKIDAAVSAGTSLTTTALTFGHSIGDEVQKVSFNQWKIYGNTTNTTSGATPVATVDMMVDAPSTVYINTGTEYAYYFTIPYDSVNAVTGDYSDGVAKSTGYPSNSVGSLIESALSSCKKNKGGIITDEWLMGEINDCSEYIASKLKRWSHLQSFDYVLGQSTLGSNVFALPSDIQEKNSIKSILGVRIGGELELRYKDKKDWNKQLRNVLHTQVRTEAAVGAVTLEIDNSYDFADSGSVAVYVSGTKYTITYTGVTRSSTAGILTGVPASGTGSITVTTPVDSNVWYDQDEGQPEYFDVYDGNLYIYPLVDTSYDKFNVYLDYYTVRTKVNSASDIVEPTRYLLYKHWLCWKLRGLDNASGQLNPSDMDFVLFSQMLGESVGKEVTGQRSRMFPKVNKISY